MLSRALLPHAVFLLFVALYPFLLIPIISCDDVMTHDARVTSATNTDLRGYPLSSTSRTSIGFAFGSCNRHNRDQIIWSAIDRAITERRLVTWVWLGDAIYADDIQWPMMSFRHNELKVVEERYTFQKNNTHSRYSAVIKKVPVLGVWDDHDFGINDGDKNFIQKKEGQKLYLDFLDISPTSPIHQQSGVYSHQRITTSDGKYTVLIILLDNRTEKDPYGTSSGDFLGEAQWAWLRTVLQTIPSDITFIGSGIQVISASKPVEHWSRFSQSRQRLFDLIAETNRSRVLSLSGDIHFAEIHKLSCTSVGYPLYDFTSSGLTHYVFSHVAYLTEFFFYTPTLLHSYYGKNFGTIEIDFEEEVITAQIHNVDGIPLREEKIAFRTLEREGDTQVAFCPILFNFHFIIERLISVYIRTFDSIAVAVFRMTPSGLYTFVWTVLFHLSTSVWLLWKIFKFVIKILPSAICTNKYCGTKGKTE